MIMSVNFLMNSRIINNNKVKTKFYKLYLKNGNIIALDKF